MSSVDGNTNMDMEMEQSWSDRLVAKGRKSPFLVASTYAICNIVYYNYVYDIYYRYTWCTYFCTGVATLIGICGYGAYSFKNRKISTQMYLLQLRVTAQGAAIVCLTGGMVYHMVRKYILHEKDEPWCWTL